MSQRWHYQLNGFELGPVPEAEVRRLVQKGRLPPDAPVRPEGEGAWSTADRITGDVPTQHVDSTIMDSTPTPTPTTVREGWHLGFLQRLGPWLVPLGVALMLPQERPAWSLGALILATIAGALIRLLADAARDLGAIRQAGFTLQEGEGATRR